jgi:hypothetical protein
MSDTPRTDKAIITLEFESGMFSKLEYVTIDFARQLERELNEAKARLHDYASSVIDNREECLNQSMAFANERDEWKACAEELAKSLKVLAGDCPCELCEGAKAPLARFNKLKDQTK